MSQVITLVLRVGVLLSAIAGILFAVRIILEQTVGGSWYWGGALAAFSGPVFFSAALYLFERRPPVRGPGAAE